MKSKIEELIREIEQELDSGCKVYLRKNDLAITAFPDDSELDFFDNQWEEEQKEVDDNPEDYVEIRKWESSFSFDVMSAFVENIPNNPMIKAKLSEALAKPKPFKNFKFQIDNSENYRQEWFGFKSLKQREYVKSILVELNIIN